MINTWTMVLIYDYTITSFSDEQDNIVFDVFFIGTSGKMSCIRIKGIYLSFMICRLPGLTINQTERYVRSVANATTGSFIIETRSDLKENSHTNLFTRPFEYVEVFCQCQKNLRALHNKLYDELDTDYYPNLDYDSLDEHDKLFMRQTETPFRFTNYISSIERCKYFLSAKWDIPFVGHIEANFDLMIRGSDKYLMPSVDEFYTLIITDNHGTKMNEAFKPTTSINNASDNLTVASYDIETYNKNMVIDPKSERQYIFCIGVAFFKLNQIKPYARYSIISHDMDVNDVPKLVETRSVNNQTIYKVGDEYDEESTSTYIIVKNEAELVATFVKLLWQHKPHIINGFNNFTFDDIWIWSRIEKYKFEQQFLQVFSPYLLTDLKTAKQEHLKPTFKSFQIKLEGKYKASDHKTVRGPYVQVIDTYKMLLKADPKRFSQKGNLDTMLDVYHIKNPFNGQPLSKTGLTIKEMFDAWDNGTDIYRIAFYCLQDAWICGTLILERSQIIDKLAMATSTSTSFEDSIYLADGHRVSCLKDRYAYQNGFAIMDEAYRKRDDRIKDSSIRGMGMKTFDTRTVIGGAVRNVHAYRATGVVAGDFSSMYPSQFRSSNIASSCRVDDAIIKHPEAFGLKLVDDIMITDMYGERKIYRYDLVNKDLISQIHDESVRTHLMSDLQDMINDLS